MWLCCVCNITLHTFIIMDTYHTHLRDIFWSVCALQCGICVHITRQIYKRMTIHTCPIYRILCAYNVQSYSNKLTYYTILHYCINNLATPCFDLEPNICTCWSLNHYRNRCGRTRSRCSSSGWFNGGWGNSRLILTHRRLGWFRRGQRR